MHLIVVEVIDVTVQALFSKVNVTETVFPERDEGKLVPVIVKVDPPSLFKQSGEEAVITGSLTTSLEVLSVSSHSK